MTNPTAYTKTDPNPKGYGLVRATNFFRLLQNGSYRLLQNDTSKRLLESSVQSTSNYTKSSLNPTSYTSI